MNLNEMREIAERLSPKSGDCIVFKFSPERLAEDMPNIIRGLRELQKTYPETTMFYASDDLTVDHFDEQAMNEAGWFRKKAPEKEQSEPEEETRRGPGRPKKEA